MRVRRLIEVMEAQPSGMSVTERSAASGVGGVSADSEVSVSSSFGRRGGRRMGNWRRSGANWIARGGYSGTDAGEEAGAGAGAAAGVGAGAGTAAGA
jgi:hypothetical protein